jgi:hypothetical protein
MIEELLSAGQLEIGRRDKNMPYVVHLTRKKLIINMRECSGVTISK